MSKQRDSKCKHEWRGVPEANRWGDVFCIYCLELKNVYDENREYKLK